MTLALALTLQLFLTAGDHCYFISNTRIQVLPSCDIDPTTIDELTEDPAPPRVTSLHQAAGLGTRWKPVRPTIVVRGNEELERRLEIAEQLRIAAVAERLVAERQLEVALQQRDAALRDLARARNELAALRARARRAERASRTEEQAITDAN